LAIWTNLRLAWEPRILSLLRIVTGLLFLQHGLNKLFNCPATANHAEYNVSSLVPGLQGPIELIGGLLIVFGLFTRPAAFILSGNMAIAYFMAHAPRGFFPLQNGGNGGELAILYCFVFLYLWLAGGGAWSLDRVLRRSVSSNAGATAARAA
jgi:putative oxidoreductase